MRTVDTGTHIHIPWHSYIFPKAGFASGTEIAFDGECRFVSTNLEISQLFSAGGRLRETAATPVDRTSQSPALERIRPTNFPDLPLFWPECRSVCRRNEREFRRRRANGARNSHLREGWKESASTHLYFETAFRGEAKERHSCSAYVNPACAGFLPLVSPSNDRFDLTRLTTDRPATRYSGAPTRLTLTALLSLLCRAVRMRRLRALCSGTVAGVRIPPRQNSNFLLLTSESRVCANIIVS